MLKYGVPLLLLLGMIPSVSYAKPLILDKTIQFQDNDNVNHNLHDVIRNDQVILDDKGRINNSLVGGDTSASDSQFYARFLAGNTGADMFTGVNTVILGGQTIDGVDGAGPSIGSPAVLSIFATPDGPYNAGCAICIITGQGDWGHKRAGLSSNDPRGTTNDGLSEIVSSDATGFYNWVGNTPGYFTSEIDHISPSTSSWVHITPTTTPVAGDTQIVTGTNINTNTTKLSHSITHYFGNGGSETITVTGFTQTSSSVTIKLSSAITKVDDPTKDSYTFNDISTDPQSSSSGIRIYFKTPLTKKQLALLHTNMYIQTNLLYVPSSSLRQEIPDEVLPNKMLPGYSFYSGNIQAIDPNGRWVETPALIATGANDFLKNQIPDLTKLDTFWTNFQKPTLMFGQSVGYSSQNNYLDFNDDVNTGNTMNPTRAMRYNEVNFHYKINKKNSVSYTGLVLQSSGYPGGKYYGNDAFTADSSGIIVNMDTPLIFDIGMNGDSMLFRSPPLNIWGHGGVSDTTPIKRTFEVVGWEDGAHRFAFSGYMKKDVLNTVSPNTTSYHLGVGVDTSGAGDDHDRQFTEPPLWGSIIWNNEGITNGGMDFCGGQSTAHTACAISLTYQNALSLPNGFSVNKNTAITFGGVGNINFKTDGSIIFQSDTSASSSSIVEVGGTFGVGAASLNTSTTTVGGQGTLIKWNLGGDGASTLVNVNPNVSGGFKFYDVENGAVMDPAAYIAYISSAYTQFNQQVYVKYGIGLGSSVYAALDNKNHVGLTVYCSDCYSKLRESGYTKTGINVTWNGSDWVDSLGIVAQH